MKTLTYGSILLLVTLATASCGVRNGWQVCAGASPVSQVDNRQGFRAPGIPAPGDSPYAPVEAPRPSNTALAW